MERDPFRPQDPWKAEWDQHTQRYSGEPTAMGDLPLLVVLGIWIGTVAVLVGLSFILPDTATGIIAAIAFVLLLLTVRP